MKKVIKKKKLKNKKAFSLIEVLISVSILTIAVFGVYKLIGENTKLISNSDNFVQLNNLFYSFEECLDYLDFSNFSDKSIGKSYYFNFGAYSTGCLTGISNKVIFDNINYTLKGTITNTGTNFIDWQIEISADGVGKQVQDFRQIKN